MDRRGTRIDWMDMLRGLSMLLVILHHSTQIVSARIDVLPEALTFISNFFAPFRMPMLMFLSGLLVASSLKRSAGVYLWGKVRRIVWPIVVWTLIYVFASGGSDFAWYEPGFWDTYLWFLQFITAYYVIALLTRWVPIWLFVVVPLIGMSLLSLLSSIGMTLLPPESLEQRFLYLMPFFFFGALIERFWAQYVIILSTRWVAVLATIPLGVALFSALVTPLWYEPLAVVPAIVGILILVRLASVTPEARWLGPLRFLGKYSLIFYCVHYPVFAGLGRLAERAGITDPVIGLIVIFALTLAVSFGFAWVGRRLPVSLLFELPRRRQTVSK